MTFEVTILGCSSASPSYHRHPSAQVLNIFERFFLIDCGEGTQMQMERYKVKSQRINRIFISHLHGDHYLGLMGLLSTMHLQGRTKEMSIYGPKELKEIINIQLKYSQTILRFPIIYHDTNPDKRDVIFEDEQLSIETIILNHRIPCTGFLFKEKKKPRKLIKEMVEKYAIPIEFLHKLKDGEDYHQGNKIIKNEELTVAGNPARSYAYCSDTLYDERILESITGVNLLYHESTFMNDLIGRANETFHTTSKQAGIIAKKANAKKLLIGHFSARYKDLNPLLLEAQEEFLETRLSVEGETFRVE
jgi:ribonuclease Z